MKIGIITYWQSNDNYGQILQCYALQKYLIDKGHNVFLIRYDMLGRKHKSRLWVKILKALIIIPIISHVIKNRNEKRYIQQRNEINTKNVLRNFDGFKRKYIRSTEKVYSSLLELQNNPPEADLYITGSDQVWSQLLNNKENEVFYLNFGNSTTKRISYAASFAIDFYPIKLHSILKQNLQRFDAISVREDTGVEICKEIGCDVQKVLDPTFLIDANIYRAISSERKHSHYIYIYSINISSSKELYFDCFSQYATQQECKIVVSPASGCILGKELFDGVEYDYSTIPDWLSNIDNAELVVTTSFHGVVFCVLMHTPFIYIPLQGRFAKMNNRAVSLLKSIDLQDRIMSNSSQFEYILSNIIDWAKVDSKIISMRQQSYEYLNNNLKK